MLDYLSMELQRNTHHVFRLMYHFVWIPKYRHKIFFEPCRSDLKVIIEKIGYDYNIEIVELEIPIDHVHMVVRGEPKISPSEIMRIIKSISAREFFKKYPKIKEKFFWGGKLWTQSYFVETVGKVNEEKIREYVKNQLKQMDKLEQRFRQLDMFENWDKKTR
jgi:putative transposase